MSNLLLQILNFLPLGSNTGQCRLNIFQRLEHIVEFKVKNISLNTKHIEISLTENRSTFNAHKYFLYQTLPGFST